MTSCLSCVKMDHVVYGTTFRGPRACLEAERCRAEHFFGRKSSGVSSRRVKWCGKTWWVEMLNRPPRTQQHHSSIPSCEACICSSRPPLLCFASLRSQGTKVCCPSSCTLCHCVVAAGNGFGKKAVLARRLNQV